MTPTPAAATEDLELVFRLVDDPDLADLGKGSVWPVVEGDGVLVALNSCPEMQRKPACRRSILRSVDGLAWDIVGDPLPGPHYGYAWTEAGFLIVLDDHQQGGTVLYRSDDGLTWEPMPLRGTDYLEDLFAGPDGYLGAGCDRHCARSRLFRSTDGRRWTRVTDLPNRLELIDAASAGGTLVAIGESLGFDYTAVVFRNGEWAEPDLPLPPEPTRGFVHLARVAALQDGGFVIAGAVHHEKGAVKPFLLTSADGVAWDRTSIDLDAGQTRMWAAPYSLASGPGLLALDMVLTGRGAKALGLDHASAVAWSRRPGDWRLATLPLAPDGSQADVRDVLITTDGRVVAVGALSEGRTSRPAIWVGSFEERSQAQPSPGPLADDEAASTPVPEWTPGWRKERAQQEQELLTQASYTTCHPFRARGDFDPFGFGATAAIQCDRPAPGIGQVAAFRFPDATSISDYWSYRIESLPASVPASGGACQEGEIGHATWAHGSVACYRSSETRKAKVRWTDTRTNTYWLADADHMNVVRLARWVRDDRPSQG